MNISRAQSQISNFSRAMGVQFNPAQLGRVQSYKTDSEQMDSASREIGNLRDDMALFDRMDNQTFNNHQDLAREENRIHHEYGGPAHTMDYERSADHSQVLCKQTDDGKITHMSVVEHHGDQWRSYSLTNLNGFCSAVVIEGHEGPDGRVEREEWNLAPIR